MKNISFHIWYFIAVLFASCSSDGKSDIMLHSSFTIENQVVHVTAKGIKQIANNQVCMVSRARMVYSDSPHFLFFIQRQYLRWLWIHLLLQPFLGQD